MRTIPSTHGALALCFVGGFACQPPNSKFLGDTGLPTGTPGDSAAEVDAPDDPRTDSGSVPSSPRPAAWQAPELPAATISALGAEIDSILDGMSARHGVQIVDLDNGQLVYERDPDGLYKPASNTKLFTSGALMGLLGEEHRLPVEAWVSGGVSGSISSLVVRVEHDWSWSSYFYDNPYVPIDALADTLATAGIGHVGTVELRGEALVEGYRFGYLDPAGHRADALDALEDALWLAGISYDSARVSSSLSPPSAGSRLVQRDSVPLSVLTHPVNDISHNEMADMGMRHLGYVIGRASAEEVGGEVVLDWLSGLGIDVGGMVFYDGSGLSHSNRVTARSIVELLRHLLDQPEGEAWRRTFSLAGMSGTLASRMTGADTAGRFWGKTGTLNGVIATSGVLYHRHDGHRYLVAQLMNDVGDSTRARSLHDQVIRTLAEDWRDQGLRPEAPTLRRVAPGRGRGRVAVDWSPVDGAVGYQLEITARPHDWSAAEKIYVGSDTSYVVDQLTEGGRYDVRVFAVNEQGVSHPSDVYTADAGPTEATVLMVDGYDRYASQSDTPLPQGHLFVSETARAMPQEAVATVDNDWLLDGGTTLDTYPVVVWVLGEESTEHETFSRDEQALVEAFVDNGGGLLVSGAEVGWDLAALGDIEDQGFYAEVLGGDYLADDAATYEIVPRAGGLFEGLPVMGFYRPGWIDVAYPDRLGTGAGGTAELEYVGGTGGTAATSWEFGAGRVMLMGFPLGAIDGTAQREEVMSRVLGFLRR